MLFVPRHNQSFGPWAFRVSDPKVWNTLPSHIRQSQSLSAFRRHLTTYYFQLSYRATYRPFTNAPWFCSFRLWRFINHLLTYLLTYLHEASEKLENTQRVQTTAEDFHVLFLAAYRNHNSGVLQPMRLQLDARRCLSTLCGGANL